MASMTMKAELLASIGSAHGHHPKAKAASRVTALLTIDARGVQVFSSAEGDAAPESIMSI